MANNFKDVNGNEGYDNENNENGLYATDNLGAATDDNMAEAEAMTDEIPLRTENTPEEDLDDLATDEDY